MPKPFRSPRFCLRSGASAAAMALALGLTVGVSETHAQLQDVGGGVSVDLSVLGGGYSAYTSAPQGYTPYATATPGTDPHGLRMPAGTMPGSTFYGLGTAPNDQRLPAPRPMRAQPAPTQSEPMTAEPAQPAPEPPSAPAATAEAAPAPAPAPASAVEAPEPLPEATQTAASELPPPPPLPTAEEAAAPPPPPAPSAAPPEPPEPTGAAEPVETAAVSAEAPAAPPDTGLTRLQFSPGESKPTQAASDSLRTIGQQLLADDSLRLEIRAFAGGDGMSDNRARRLSLARALAVRSDLIEQGVRSNRIDVRALGNKTDEEPLNRVDLAVSGG